MVRDDGIQILLECLQREGVSTIFGYPGGVVLPLYDTLPQFPAIQHVLVRHEQGAAHMADGYARASGEVGVCLATSGPGATNLVTGIATSYLDSTPMVAITGNVARTLLGKDGFQEADITGITQPITKHNYLVMRAEDIAMTVREAFHIARTGRPRAGTRRHSQGRVPGGGGVRLAGGDQPARLPSNNEGPLGDDPAGG